MNDEFRHRTLELNDTNVFLETILSTIGVAVAVLDHHQRVQAWNRQAYELWGLTPEGSRSRICWRLTSDCRSTSSRPSCGDA